MNKAEAKRWYVTGALNGKRSKATGKPGEVTLAEIAAHYGITTGHVKKTAAQEKWTTERREYLAEVDAGAKEKLKEFEIEALTEIRRQNYALAKDSLEVFKEQLRDGVVKFTARDALEIMKYIDGVGEIVHGVSDPALSPIEKIWTDCLEQIDD